MEEFYLMQFPRKILKIEEFHSSFFSTTIKAIVVSFFYNEILLRFLN
jgi:hypothetical protein